MKRAHTCFIALMALCIVHASQAATLSPTATIWHNTQEAIGNCAEFKTSLPRAQSSDPFMELHIYGKMVGNTCQITGYGAAPISAGDAR